MDENSPLLPHLACPLCRSRLEPRDGGLRCTGDDQHPFEVLNGVPILLRPEARASLGEDMATADQMATEYKLGLGARVRKWVKALLGANRHLRVAESVRRIWEAEQGVGLSLEVGSGVTDDEDPLHVNLDIAPFPNVDVVGSALDLPFADHTFHLMRNLAVLEHVRDPGRMVGELHRTLAPGGYVYTEVPFVQHFHAYPNDFQRYTTEGLKWAFREFEVVETGVCVGPGSALTALAGDYAELLTFSRSRLLSDLARLIPLVLLLPLKFLDPFLVRHNPRAHEIASGIYVLARKPVSSSPGSAANPLG